MSPRRQFISDDARIVDLAQKFDPNYMREYLMWAEVWRRDPDNGRGLLPAPAHEPMRRGSGVFWEVIDNVQARVQCFEAVTVRIHLESLLEGAV